MFLQNVPYFLAYFGAAALLATAFLALYVRVTPNKEFALIREGKSAVAIQLVGTFLGFAIPMAIVIGHSVSIPDMLAWGGVSLVVQLASFFILTRMFKEIEARVANNCHACGTLMGGLALGFGILQAACMVP